LARKSVDGRPELTTIRRDVAGTASGRILKAMLAGAAGAWGAHVAAPERAAAQTKHIRLYVEMDVAPGREREMVDLFHNQFVPEAVKHEGKSG
jgi:hypothetical protein